MTLSSLSDLHWDSEVAAQVIFRAQQAWKSSPDSESSDT